MTDSPFIADFKALLAKHDIKHPEFAYGAGAFDGKVLYSGPMFDDAEIVAGVRALVEGKWSVAGEYTHRFEAAFSRYLNQAESVMVNSGSSADLLMIAAAKKRYGWQDGDGIIVSTVGFPTTVSAITLNGLRPVFVDIEWDTLNFDLDQVEQSLVKYHKRVTEIEPVGDTMTKLNSDGSSTRSWWANGAVVRVEELPAPIHIRSILISPVLGNPPNMDRLTAFAAKYDVKLLLDGCDSLGSTWRDKHLAEYCAASTCSFFPSHHISTIQGGMISSNDRELVTLARSMSAWGRDCFCVGAANLLPRGTCGCRFSNWLKSCPDLTVDHKYVYSQQGYNLQPLDLQAAIGLEQMEKLSMIHEARQSAYRKIAKTVRRANFAADTVDSLIPASPSWFGVPIVCETPEFKARLVAHLESNGIQTRNYFAGNILLHPGYAHLDDAKGFPNANEVLKRVFFVGCAPFYTDKHFAHIEKVIKSFTS